MKFLPFIWAGLWRKPLRTIFTLISILIAFLLFGLLQGVNSAMQQVIVDQHVNRLFVQNKISMIESLPSGHLPQIESVPGVQIVSPMNYFGGYYQDPKNQIFTFAVDPEKYFKLYPEFQIAPEQLDAFIKTRTAIVMPKSMADQYGWKVGDKVPLKSMIFVRQDGSQDWQFDLVGVYNPGDTQKFGVSALLRYDYFDEGRRIAKGTMGSFMVGIDDPNRAADIGREIDKLFANSAFETRTQTEKEFAQAQLKSLGDIDFIVNSIVGAVFFTLLILTGNTMIHSFDERVPEFAVMKTLGFSDRSVLGLLLAEAAVLCVLAALLGLGAAQAIFPLASSVLGSAHLPGPVVAAGVALALLLAALTGTPPAWRAMRLKIVDALAER